ncbi:uncharacterized protein RJT21DRAFT_25579 [Scheffersomyces amazonensis]|uniref:uncharacterized protein n=1 Tax=Scheffersomyces amazonensis TaxID=1078765 RepID=UPI00315D237D
MESPATIYQNIRLNDSKDSDVMLFALATPGSAFKPSIKKIDISWRLEKFKRLYSNKGGKNSPEPISAAYINTSELDFFDF